MPVYRSNLCLEWCPTAGTSLFRIISPVISGNRLLLSCFFIVACFFAFFFLFFVSFLLFSTFDLQLVISSSQKILSIYWIQALVTKVEAYISLPMLSCLETWTPLGPFVRAIWTISKLFSPAASIVVGVEQRKECDVCLLLSGGATLWQ